MSDGQITGMTLVIPLPQTQDMQFQQQQYLVKQWYECVSGLQHQKHENEKELLRIKRGMELELARTK